jgi:hypothetical protein
MDKPRPAAERVRPILQAMERSIDAARRRRLHTTGDDGKEENVAKPAEHETAPPNGEPAPRLKARPKRPGSFSDPDGGESFHSRAS